MNFGDVPVTIPGATLRLGAKDFTLAPTPLGCMDVAEIVMKGVKESGWAEYNKALQTVIYAGLKRNHPDITPEFVADNIDFANYQDVLNAFMVANKFIKSEVQSSGEASASQ